MVSKCQLLALGQMANQEAVVLEISSFFLPFGTDVVFFLCIAVSNTDPDTCAPEVKPHLSITEPLLRWKFRAFCHTMLLMYLGTAMTLA